MTPELAGWLLAALAVLGIPLAYSLGRTVGREEDR